MKRTKRFQVSLLSKGRSHEAVPEEVMIDKTTGEILVKSPMGHFASYDYISRTQSAMERIQSLCELRGFFPTIHRLTIDNVFFPVLVDDVDNIVNERVAFPIEDGKKVRDLMVYVDANSIETTTDCRNGILPIEPDVAITITFKQDGSEETYTQVISGPMSQINGMVFNGKRFGSTNPAKVYITHIDSIRVIKNATLAATPHQNLIHNIFICYKA